MEKLIPYLVNSLFSLVYQGTYREFLKSGNIKKIQEKKLIAILAGGRESEYGRLYGFSEIRNVEDFQRQVPLTDYEDYLPTIEKIKRGEKQVLTAEEILLLEPSSGSASASKLIPYTHSLRREFQQGLRPWLYDLYHNHPGLKRGKSYWSVTPAAAGKRYTEGGIPIGFEDDKAYFGCLEKMLLDRVMAVPSGTARSVSMADFYRQTSLGLLQCRNLTLISVWNPSFLILILEHMRQNAAGLTAEIGQRDRKRAQEVRGCLEREDYSGLWPDLQLISCWADAQAGTYADRLRALFPRVDLQPKGLLATEGFVSFPLTAAGGAVLSIRSHFFEFQSAEDGLIRTADRLEAGGRYRVILTTSGGLYRYQLGDLIQVQDFFRGIPVIKFLGKEDKVSDLFGEKLNEIFVRDTLDKLGIRDGFRMLAPEGNRYVLYLEAAQTPGLEAGGIDPGGIDAALGANFHYAYCRQLDQLQELRIFILWGNPEQEYLAECVSRGQKLGNIKPAVLSIQGGWDKVFKGGYR